MTEPAWRARFRAAEIGDVEWARDEPERVLYETNRGGTWQLHAWDRRADAHRRLTDRPDGTRDGLVEPGGERVWWFDDDAGDEFGRWVTQPFAGGVPEPAAPDVSDAYSAGLALGRGVAVIGTSTGEGSAIHVARRGVPSRRVYAHAQSAWAASLSRDGALLAIGHSEHGDSLHPAARVLDLEGDVVGDLFDGPERALYAGAWSPVPGDARLIVAHEREDLPRPLLWDPRARTTAECGIDLPGEVHASWYPDASALLLVHDRAGRSELYRYRLADGSLARIETAPGSIESARVRPDGDVWYLWTDARTPREVRSTRGTVLAASEDGAPPGATYAAHEVDGIPVFVAEPAGPRPHPTLFRIHGGPTAHDTDAFSPAVQAWVDHGFAVVMVNYRGSTGLGRTWRDALVGNPGFTELADVAAVRAWALRSGLADPARLVLAGRSWGGYLTLLGLGTQPQLWSLGVAGVPVADYVAAYEDEMEPLKKYDDALFGGSPAEIPDRYRARSPIEHAENVRVPVLVLAGENDPRCPIRQIDTYVARLAALGKPHEVYRYAAGHRSLVVDEQLRQIETEIAFVARHLGTRPPRS